MRMIRPCSRCAAPVTLRMTSCPHCGEANRAGVVFKTASAVAAFVGGASITGTLAACYGAPCAEGDSDCPRYVPRCSEVSKTPTVDDADGDGYCLSYDCNEKDPKINKAAKEIPGDGIDQDCDGHDQPK